MTVTLAQPIAEGTAATGVVSATLASPPTPGNIIVAIIGSNVGPTLTGMATPNLGWTAIDGIVSNGGNSINIYARVVQSGEDATYTASSNGGTAMFLQVYELTGAESTVEAAIPAANHSSNASGASGASLATSAVTPESGKPAYAIAGVWWQGGATSAQAASGGFTIHPVSTNRGASADLSIDATSGSYATTFSWTNNRYSAVALVVVQGPAESGSGQGFFAWHAARVG